jgi:hypothetical protein
MTKAKETPEAPEASEAPEATPTFGDALAAVHTAYDRLTQLQAQYMALDGLAQGDRRAPVIPWTVGISTDGETKQVEVKIDLDILTADTKEKIAVELLGNMGDGFAEALSTIATKAMEARTAMTEEASSG